MLTFTTLASGSGGNAALVSCGDTHVLLDAGISAKQITAGLAALGLSLIHIFADGVAVKTPGDLVFPYVQKNVDRVLSIPDVELVDAFLDVMEKHKMVVENAGLLTVAALKHLDMEGKNVVSVLSGGNMDVITMASLVQHGLINRGRIFTFSVLLPDRPGELMRVSGLLARNSGNIIKLEHNQFVNITGRTE